jgi:hypothetical protein
MSGRAGTLWWVRQFKEKLVANASGIGGRTWANTKLNKEIEQNNLNFYSDGN